MWWPLDPYGWWAYVGWFILFPFIWVVIGLIYLLDWLFPKKRPGTWFLNRIGA